MPESVLMWTKARDVAAMQNVLSEPLFYAAHYYFGDVGSLKQGMGKRPGRFGKKAKRMPAVWKHPLHK